MGVSHLWDALNHQQLVVWMRAQCLQKVRPVTHQWTLSLNQSGDYYDKKKASTEMKGDILQSTIAVLTDYGPSSIVGCDGVCRTQKPRKVTCNLSVDLISRDVLHANFAGTNVMHRIVFNKQHSVGCF
eukprot:m.62211 g.62211  ORF g.62211 m.62211 type:complete len:128 (-) comp17655_c0_seq2:718-1101(-)